MISAPKLTVVLPTYNEAENLQPMVEALFNLSVENLHILVVDDGSPDGTGQIAEDCRAEFPTRIQVMHRTQKNGLGPAYIAGFRWALDRGLHPANGRGLLPSTALHSEDVGAARTGRGYGVGLAFCAGRQR